MKRLLAPLMLTAGIVIAACGSDDDDGTAPEAAAEAPGTTAPAEAATASTVNIAEIDGFGAVLTDSEGRVLYTADEEASPDVLCTDACEEFWTPLDAGSQSPTGAPGVTGVGVASRPDGSQQVTVEGRRLYTFSLDSPGEVTGDGFSDTFGDQRFTWHAALVGASAGGSTVDSPGY